jgi:hypothetical protein
MGDTLSANHEWIELYNSGNAAVSLAGWTLDDGMNLTIPLQGTLNAGEYAVLERTSDESASGVAFLVYTGALVNTGATLYLRDATGALADQVSGGEDWSGIGGDNVTKETAQYTESGWVTAPGTPGKQNASVGTVREEPLTPSVRGASGKVATPSPAPTLTLSRTPNEVMTVTPALPERAFVGQVVTFSVTTTGVGSQLAPSIDYQWNFGDSYTALGKEVTHRYEYPGEYVVTLEASVAGRSATAEVLLTVLPISVSLTRNQAGDVQINNDSGYLVDLSGYTLTGNHTIVLPPGTRIASRGTITIATKRLEAVPGMSLVALADQQGVHLAYAVPVQNTKTETLAIAQTKPLASSYRPPKEERSNIPLARADMTSAPPVFKEAGLATLTAESMSDRSPAGKTSPTTPPSSTRHYLGFLFLLLGALVAIWTIPRSTTEPTKEGM